MRLAALLASFLSLVACGGAAPQDAGPAGEAPDPCEGVASDCSVDADCPTETICADCRRCAPDPGQGSCAATSDCPQRTACRRLQDGAGSCVRTHCESTAECETGESCDAVFQGCVFGDCSTLGCPGEQRCRPEDRACVSCLSDRDCPGADVPRCEREAGSCVECLGDGDCTGLAGPRCGAGHSCLLCVEDADCPVTTPHCNQQLDACFECVADEDCPLGSCSPEGRCGLGPVDGESCVGVACAPGHLCIVGDICRARCDVYAPVCPPDRLCSSGDNEVGRVQFLDGELAGACLPPNGGPGVGEPCADVRCEWGALCLPDSAGVSTCVGFCDPATPGSCPQGTPCLGIPLGEAGQDVFVCSQPTTLLGPCTSDESCDPGQGCTPIPDGVGGLTPTCYETDGTGDAATPCSDDATCRSGFCLGSAATPGFCYAFCTSSADCAGGHCLHYTSVTDGVSVELPFCAPGCASDRDCAQYDGRVCWPTQDPDTLELYNVCDRPFGASPPGGPCSADEDCRSGACWDGGRGSGEPGICSSPCELSTDCQAPSVCDEVALLLLADDMDPASWATERVCTGAACAANADCDPRSCLIGPDPVSPWNHDRLSCSAGWGSGDAGDPCASWTDCRSGTCFQPWTFTPDREPEGCADGLDDDGDGAVDCADPDCAATSSCRGGGEECAATTDVDGDGLAGCADPDCAFTRLCKEACVNGVDDDGDGAPDCLDGSCAFTARCGMKVCYGPCASDADCSEGTICDELDFVFADGTRQTVSGCLP